MNEQVSSADGRGRLTCTTGVVRESVARPQEPKVGYSRTQRTVVKTVDELEGNPAVAVEGKDSKVRWET
jgi:hypothetical protein